MLTSIKNLASIQVPIIPLTSGAAISAGDVVAMAADDHKIDPAADTATAAVGWAAESASAADETVAVYEGFETVEATMPYVGTPVAVGTYVGLDVTTSVQKVNMDDVTNHLFVLRAVDTTAGTCKVTLIPTCKQLTGVEVG
jgi:hypothetical protein